MLEEYLSLNIFQLLLVFSRIGTFFMLMPGVSAPYVTAQLRFGLAMMVCILVMPIIAPVLPPQPEAAGNLFFLFGAEVLIGGFFGIYVQILMAALHQAGTSISYSGGMANAMVFDPISEQQGAMVNGLLGNIAVLLIFSLNLHHLMFKALIETYTLIPPGGAFPINDMTDSLVQTMSKSAVMGVQLASPFITFGLVFYLGMGVLARLSPQMNIFFVALPIQLVLAMTLLMIVVPTIMIWFMTYLEGGLTAFLGGGF